MERPLDRVRRHCDHQIVVVLDLRPHEDIVDAPLGPLIGKHDDISRGSTMLVHHASVPTRMSEYSW